MRLSSFLILLFTLGNVTFGPVLLCLADGLDLLAVEVDPYSPDIRRALVVTALGVVVAEAQKLSSDLQNQAAG